MLIPAIVDLFKHKFVGGIIILTCCSAFDRLNLAKSFSLYGMTVAFSCNSSILERIHEEPYNGVLYIPSPHNSLKEVRLKHSSHWYKWLLINEIPEYIKSCRYDADIVLLRTENGNGEVSNAPKTLVFFDDLYVHPRDGPSLHTWAYWSEPFGLQLLHERERVLRRFDFKKYPLKIATPMGYFSEDWYNGSFGDYLADMTVARERDAGIRCTYASSVLLTEALNAEHILVPTRLWSTEINNSSMLLMLKYGTADLAGAVLRMLPERIKYLDYALGIWHFQVGFSYVSERESSSNLFVQPFAPGVWWTCIGFVIIMALAQRITAKKPVEKEGAFMAVLATYLQQDASAVPAGMSGRGRSGPDSLRALADSRYAIASEDYDYMRYLMFDVETNWADLEYLKRKKKTSLFYVSLERGIELLRSGDAAFHTEYNHLYPNLRTFTDDQLCKLQQVDTIPKILSWTTTTRRGQWIDFLRSKGAWLYETGLARQLLSRFKIPAPPCRSALLAERVNFGDILPALQLSAVGVLLSLMILVIEAIFAKLQRRNLPVLK
ncbi:unnamed protein product, partial [Iphiclides podalirius]